MTRKEAIAKIKDHMSVHKIYEERAVKITEALNMAISALEQTEPLVLNAPTIEPERSEIITDTKAVPSNYDCVNLSERVTATYYDEEHEEWSQKTVTIRDVLDSVCENYTVIEPEQIGDPDRIYAELSKVYNTKGLPDDVYSIIGDLMISLPDEPERKKGRWIKGEHDVAMCDGYRCDKCGFFVPWDYQHKFIDFIKDYHFCPNCGAEMEDSEDIPMEYFESGGR